MFCRDSYCTFSKTLLFVLATLLIASFGEARAANTDRTFGLNGRFTNVFCGGGAGGGDVYVQPSGRIVYAGGFSCPGSMFTLPWTGIVGVTSSGLLDTAFGSGGKLTFGGSFSWSSYNGSAMQTDGKLLVYYANSCPDFSSTSYSLFRLTVDGAIDATFNAVLPSVSGSGLTRLAVALAPDGKITVIQDTTPKTLIRFNPDGSRDQTFGIDGIKTLPATRLPNSTIIGMVLDERGRLAIGYRNGSVARCNSDGELDRSFGIQGIAAEYLGTGRSITFNRIVLPADGNCLWPERPATLRT